MVICLGEVQICRFACVAESGCPADFEYIESHNVCYHAFGTNLQWKSASQYCRALDSRAHLLVISNEEEQQLITQDFSQTPRK